MNKYEGMDTADAVLERVCLVRRKRAGTGAGAVARAVAAALITGLCFGIKYLPLPFADKVTDTVREAVCYDVLGRETGGTIADEPTDRT